MVYQGSEGERVEQGKGELCFKAEQFQGLILAEPQALSKLQKRKFSQLRAQLKNLVPKLAAIHAAHGRGMRSLFHAHAGSDSKLGGVLYEVFSEQFSGKEASQHLGLLMSLGADIIQNSDEIALYDKQWRDVQTQLLFDERMEDLKHLALADQQLNEDEEEFEDAFNIEDLENELASYSKEASALGELIDAEAIANNLIDPQLKEMQQEYLDIHGNAFRLLNEDQVYVIGVQSLMRKNETLGLRFGISCSGASDEYYMLDFESSEVRIVRGGDSLVEREIGVADFAVLDLFSDHLLNWIERLPAVLAVGDDLG